MKARLLVACLVVCSGQVLGQWNGYGANAQHTALAQHPSQALRSIHWSAPVDLNPPNSNGGGPLYIHYGTPLVTAGNTVLVPVKTSSLGNFQIQAFHNNGSLFYTLNSDYTLPAHNWIPPYGPALGIRGNVYFPGVGGTVYNRTSVDSATGATSPLVFYGISLYNANSAQNPSNKSIFDSTVQISTPLTVDRYGTVYFGFVVTGSNPAGLTSGIARIAQGGSIGGMGSWVSISALGIGDSNVTQPALNAAPVLSVDQQTLYFVAANGSEFGYGYLVALNSTTLVPTGKVELLDPRGGTATVSTDSSASPMVGPDGDVYFGVLEGGCCTSHNDRGWMLHYNAALTQAKTPGSFGWDTTAAVVPSTAVASYTGRSSYLLLTKYNNYAGAGTGNGVNKLAVLDPNATMQDEYSISPVTVMKEVITIAGATAQPEPGFPNAVREWCINTAVVDPFTKAAMVNSEDGYVYRWDFTTNLFTQKVQLTGGIGEAYTPTVIGPDGTVYAINDAKLFAVGN